MDSDPAPAGPPASFASALLAFVALPGVVAFIVPLCVALGWQHLPPRNAAGWLPVGVGTAVLLWCVREFHVAGRGTLAPWSPPRDMVTSGPYRFTRNPMYVAVALVLFGWGQLFGSTGLLVYALVVVLAFHLRILLSEEPWLARTFPDQWPAYRQRVPRWLL
jgi:protein-S-isoprenylcysteine O-methyltransferase Ste14